MEGWSAPARHPHGESRALSRQDELQLIAPDGGALTDPWPLKTLPAPDAAVELRRQRQSAAGHLRLRRVRDLPFPSSFRKVNSTPSGTLDMDERLRPVEKNGFTIIEVTPEKMTFRLFVWRPPQPEDEIDTMEPVMTYEVRAGK